MNNMIDYIKEYGNFTLDDYPFNEVDALIFCQLTYLKLENAPIDIENTFTSIHSFLPYIDIVCKTFRRKEENQALLFAICDSLRYKGLKVGYICKETNEDIDAQFYAITFTLEKGIYNIAFRGTDASIVGWKEDFILSFNPTIASQLISLRYLSYIHSKFHGKFRLMGHSKGGNVALYAADHTLEYKDLIQIYNFDGPGFIPGSIDVKSVYLIYRKYVPQCSIIGLLQQEDDQYTIVKSDANTIFQHDLMSWSIVDGHLETCEHLDKTAVFIKNTIDGWLMHASYEKRKVYIETLFYLLEKENVDLLSDLQFSNLKNIIHSYRDLDEEMKSFIQNINSILIQSNVNQTKKLLETSKEEISQTIKNKLPGKKNSG